ncbi:hypothetical protein AB0G86_16770 [Streptomyces scabiei]
MGTGRPDGAAAEAPLTGIAFHPSGEVLISGKRDGRPVRGSAERGFTVVGRFGLSVPDMARVDGRLFLAAAKSGTAKLTADGVRVLHDELLPRSVTEGDGRVYRPVAATRLLTA